tara:strand:- start:941 stop:1348 length:408 start_codon:yes stop_codon:yes gene_type:complete
MNRGFLNDKDTKIDVGLLRNSLDIQIKRSKKEITEEKIEEILSIIVRQRSNANNSEKIGSIRIFDIPKSADTEKLRHDSSIKKVFTLYDLRQALSTLKHPIILIPETSAIDRIAVSEICEHYRDPKTIFFEYLKS